MERNDSVHGFWVLMRVGIPGADRIIEKRKAATGRATPIDSITFRPMSGGSMFGARYSVFGAQELSQQSEHIRNQTVI